MDIPRRLGWVWRTRPEAPPDGLQAMLVRAANAAATTGNGVDFAANYRAWKELLGDRVLPWTWLGPPASTDGVAAAEVVVAAAPDEPLYVVWIEQGLPDLEAEAFAERLRQLAPGALLGFSSYPTRAQAASFGVPWDACVAVFDLGLPQVYFASQRAELERVAADHRGRPLHVVVSPGEDGGWLATAKTGLERHLGVSIWRHGLDQFAQWARELDPGGLAPQPAPPSAPADDAGGGEDAAGTGGEAASPRRRSGASREAIGSPARADAGAKAVAAGGRAAAAAHKPGQRPSRAVAVRAGDGEDEAVTTAPAAFAPGGGRNGELGRKGRGARAPDQAAGGRNDRAGRAATRPAGSAAAQDATAPADDEPAGVDFDMATIADLENALRKVLNEGAGRDQPSWAATSSASYQAARAVPERLAEASTVAKATREAVDAAHLALTERLGQVAGIAQATREAVDGLDLDLPDRQVKAIADAIAARLLDVPPATLTDDEVQSIADAIAARLLDIPLGMVALDDASISRVGDEVADRVAGRLGPTVISALREQFSRE